MSSDTDKPWLCEGDTLDFVCQKTGYLIALRRHPQLLHWCGYVGIPPEHPWHGKTYQAVEDDIHVHGGLTYSHNRTMLGSVDNGMWWFGFDCAHCDDLVPGMTRYIELRGGVYRTIEYAKGEAIRLAEQLASVAPKEKVSILDINRMFR